MQLTSTAIQPIIDIILSIYSMKNLRAFPLFLFSLLSVASYGQMDSAHMVNESPYQTVYTHLHYLQPETYDISMAALAINPTLVADSLTRQRRAVELKQILDAKGLFVHMERLPRDPDFIDTVTHRSEYVLFPERAPEIYLTKSNGKWYYADHTTQMIPQWHRQYFPLGTSTIMQLFPSAAHKTFLGFAIWQYVGFGLIILVCFILNYLLQVVIRPFVRRIFKKIIDSDETQLIALVDKLTKAFCILLVLIVMRILLPMLMLPVSVSQIFYTALGLLQITAFSLMLYRLVNIFCYYLKRLAIRTENRMDDQLVPLLQKLGYVVIVVGAIIQALHLLDINVTALIAGVSIGGLAIALAAQDAVKNFIGSIMIFADKPFQVGDYIVGSDFEGEVIEVGFRTTRIKSIDTSIISVPNGTLSNQNVTNLGVRNTRLFDTLLTMTYSSQADDLRRFIEDLKQLILTHPKLDHEKYYVHLRSLGDSSINVMFRAYLLVNTFGEELILKEEIIFKVLQLAEKNNLDFAFPSQSIYIENDTNQEENRSNERV